MNSKEPRSLRDLAYDVTDSDGNTLLHRFVLDYSDCSDSSNIDGYLSGVLRTLSGVRANASNRQGCTALQLAVELRSPRMIERLLSCVPGVDVNGRSSSRGGGRSALHRAVLLGSRESVDSVLIETLIRRGADLNAGDENGNAPLHTAVRIENLDSMKVLTEAGADLNCSNHDGDTPLHLSLREGRWELTRFLVKSGAGVNCANSQGDTPLHVVVKEGNLEMAEFLVEEGALVNCWNNHGDTPLHVALREGRFEVVKFLVGKCRDLNWRNSEGHTPLHVAVKKDSRK